MTLKKYKMENESNKQTAYKINQGDYLMKKLKSLKNGVKIQMDT